MSELEERQRVVEIARSWLGTPYVNHARVKGAGVDCGQLLGAVFFEAGLIPYFDIDYYPEQWHMHRDEEKYLGTVEKFSHQIVGPPLPGDVVMFKFGRVFSHSGIVIGWPNIIHAIRLSNCTIDNVERCTIGPKALANLPRLYFSCWGRPVSLFQRLPSVVQINGIQIQSAVSALPLPLIYGSPRVPCNIIYANGFNSVTQQTSGGKGILTAGKQSNQKLYYATLIAAIGEGPLKEIIEIFQDSNQWFNLSYVREVDPNTQIGKNGQPNFVPTNAQFFPGGEFQEPWSYIVQKWPEDARSYKDICYIALPNMQLDSSGTPPQLNFVPRGTLSGTCPLNPATLTGEYTDNDGQHQSSFFAGLMDADPALVVNDFLTDEIHGIGFPAEFLDISLFSSPAAFASNIGDASFQTYCQAVGFGWSVVLNNTEAGSSILDRWMRNTATAIVWTGETLKFIPYLGSPSGANPGFYTDSTSPAGTAPKYFTPLVTPLFDLTDLQFLQAHNPEEEPVTLDRIDPVDAYNFFRVSFQDRANQFNENIAEDSDEVQMELFGPRMDRSGQADEFSLMAYAQQSAIMQLRRSVGIRKHVTFRLPPVFGFLDPMDILTVTSGTLSEFGVRITSIEEDADGSLTVIAEEYQTNRVTSFLTDLPGPPAILQTNAPVGDVNPPAIFEPTAQLIAAEFATGSGVIVGLSGGPNRTYDPNWGGARVYISLDNATYRTLNDLNGQPVQIGPSIQGYLTANIAAFSGTNPDNSDVLSVDLRESNGELTSTTTEVALQLLPTLCVVIDVDGCYELLSYTTATLTGLNQYNLAGLYRGLYGTPALAHLTGAQFLRLAQPFFEARLQPQYIGVPLFLKFTSFNAYNQSEQDLSDVVAYLYTPTGAGIDYNTNPIVVAVNAGLTVDLNTAIAPPIDLNVAGATECSPTIFIIDLGPPPVTPTLPKLYFEVTLTAQASEAGFGLGIAQGNYQLDFPFDCAVPGGGSYSPPSSAYGIVQATGDTSLGGGGFGYPLTEHDIDTFSGYDTLGMTMGCAFDPNTNQLWFGLIDGTLIWSNNGDPVTSTNGIDYSTVFSNTVPLFVVVGAYSENLAFSPGDANFAAGMVNFGASPFVLGLPAGYEAVDSTGATTLDPAAKSSQITLSGGDLSFTGTSAPPDSQIPFYAVLSNKPLRTS